MNLSLNVELVKNEGMKGSNFFPQGIRRYGESFKMTSSNDTWMIPWLAISTCHSMPQTSGFAYCKITKNGRDRICQKWVFSLFTKISKFYLDRLGYYANLPRNTCTQSEPHTENTLIESEIILPFNVQYNFRYKWNFCLGNFKIPAN